MLLRYPLPRKGPAFAPETWAPPELGWHMDGSAAQGTTSPVDCSAGCIALAIAKSCTEHTAEIRNSVARTWDQ